MINEIASAIRNSCAYILPWMQQRSCFSFSNFSLPSSYVTTCRSSDSPFRYWTYPFRLLFFAPSLYTLPIFVSSFSISLFPRFGSFSIYNFFPVRWHLQSHFSWFYLFLDFSFLFLSLICLFPYFANPLFHPRSLRLSLFFTHRSRLLQSLPSPRFLPLFYLQPPPSLISFAASSSSIYFDRS